MSLSENLYQKIPTFEQLTDPNSNITIKSELMVFIVPKQHETMVQQLSYLIDKNGIRFNLFFVINNTDLLTQAMSALERKYAKSQLGDVYQYFLLDENKTYIDSLDSNKEQLIFCRMNQHNLDTLNSKKNLTAKQNWIDLADVFFNNYNQTEPTDKNLYKWGQQVREDGDYICVDCGYIQGFRKGQVFDVCEACLSGEIDGPSGPNEGYWEKV
jgi:hypothetical protein